MDKTPIEADKITSIKIDNSDELYLLPTNIFLQLYFTVRLKSDQILKDYGVMSGYNDYDENPNTPDNNEPESSDEQEPTDAQLRGDEDDYTPKKKKTYKVDYNEFYTYVRKKLSNTNIFYKLRDQVRAGVFKMGNWEINQTVYVPISGEMSVQRLYKLFVEKDRNNKDRVPIDIKYGIEFSLVAKDDTKYDKNSIISEIKNFVIQFNNYVLTDDDFISFVSKNEQTPSNIES